MPARFNSKYSRGVLLLALSQAKLAEVVPEAGSDLSMSRTRAPPCESQNATDAPTIPTPMTATRIIYPPESSTATGRAEPRQRVRSPPVRG